MRILYSFILLLLVLSSSVTAQNLVQNPSFETYTSCPTTSSQVALATPWNTAQNSPEYLNSCSVDQYSDVPTSWFGFQNARTGQAYMGGLFYGSFAGSYLANLREYLYVPLSSPLTVGQTYYLSFFINLVDNSEYAVNRMGMQFTSTYNSAFPINNTAHIYSTAVVSDKVGWTQVTGSIVAGTAYNAVMVGNFFDDANTTVQFVGSSTDIGYNAYYFVEDVYVSTTPIILPIEWINVVADVDGRLATLQWEIESEGIERFLIETSDDGYAFTETQSVKAVDGQRMYAQVDTMRGHLPTAFYRIRAIEQDGSQHVSPVVEATRYATGISFLLAYPSAISQAQPLTVEYSSKGQDAATLQFYSLTGKLVREEPIPSATVGHQQLTLPMGEMLPGAYILKAGNLTQKIVVTE